MDIQNKAKKLIEMIQTAPVEWKLLGEIVPISRGKRLVRNQLKDNGQYPVYQNSLQPLGFYDDQNCRAYMTFVIAAGAAGEIGFSDIEFWAADDCYYFDCPQEILHDKFLYYFLLSERHQLTSQIRKASVPRLGRVSIEKIKIPVPPLETQQKIVKILDKFTELEATLEATLEAELALRKRQYQYYRDFLLDFDNQIGGGIADGYQCRLKDVVWKTLGEVGKFTYGYIAKAQDAGTARFIRISDINANGKLIPNGEKYIDVLPECKKYLLKKNDLLMARTGATYGKTMIFSEDYPAVYAGFLIKLDFDKNILIPKYYWHFAQGELFWRQANKLVSGGGQPQLNANALKMIKIPIPPLPEQEKIVAILDKFDTLTNSISEGLPHEVALRRKQYEYYREQLLAFPKTA